MEAVLSAPVGALTTAKLDSAGWELIEETARQHELRAVGELFTSAIDREVVERSGHGGLRRLVRQIERWMLAHARARNQSDIAYDDVDIVKYDVADDDADGADDEGLAAADDGAELDLFTRQSLRAAAAESDNLPPPFEADALRAWALERGVAERLSDPAPPVPAFHGRSVALHPATVAEVLTTPLPAQSTRRFDPNETLARVRRDTAVSTLMRFVRNVAYLRERQRELDASARPLDPALGPFAAVVARVRAALSDQPRPVGDVLPAPLRFAESPARLVYDEATSPRDTLLLGYRAPDLVDVLLGGWEHGGLSVVCRCRRPACAHREAALAQVEVLLRQPSAAAYRPLHAFITTPSWTRTFERLDRALATLPASPPERLIWRLSCAADGKVTVDAQLQKRTTQGGWSKGGRLNLTDLLRRPALLRDPQDALVAELMDAAGPGAWREQVDGAVFRAIEALAGASNVYVSDRRDVPVAIRRFVPRLELVRSPAAQEAAAGLVLRVRVGADLVAPAEVFARLGAERYWVELDAARNECRLALFERELVTVLRAFGADDARMPDEILPELLARFERLSPRARVDLPAELRGEQVAPDPGLVCRLTPVGDSGLRVELLIRPLPELAAQVPGEGQPLLIASRDGARIHCVRDLDEENARVAAFSDELGLANAPRTGSHRYELTALAEAASLVATLAELGERAARVVVEWPADAWKVARVGRGELRLAVTERRDWFGVEGGIEVDGQMVSIATLLAAVRRGERYVVLGPRRFALIEEELRRRLAALADVTFETRGAVELGAPAVEALSELVEEPAHLAAIPAFRETRARLVRAAALEPTPPEGFRADLRPYQREGFRWLMRLAEAGAGACLADDMGLGKTVQLLAVLQARASKGAALVLAPTSVVGNWLGEAARFAPGLRRILYRGQQDVRARLLEGIGPGDLVVTSYAVAVLDEELLASVPFAALVLDEAQALKNATTRRARAVRRIQADWRVALSGTPIENHLGELWSLYRVVSPALFGSWEQFRERFALPIERHHDQGRRAALAAVLRPFLLRRTKEIVAPELPPKTEIQRFIELGPEERRLYEATRLAVLESLERDPNRDLGSEAQQRIAVLAALTRLRQLACHPALGPEGAGPGTPAKSSKLAALVEILREIGEARHRALVFSQFTRFLDLVRAELDTAGITYLHLDGSTPADEREAGVAAFQRGEAVAFLISLRAGGTGLNLTAADYVIHLDPWWNPAVEDQATDRAHRIGQRKAVTVVRLVARGTVEETVLSLHADKRGLAASVLDGSDAVARLDTGDLIALLRDTRAEGEQGEAEEGEAEEVAAEAEA